MTLRIVLEVAPKRSFASALDWPGWARSGRSAEEAQAALAEYAPRYADVARRAGLALPTDDLELEVVERLDGGGSTEFGAPGEPAAAEQEPVGPGELERLDALMSAAWDTFDDAAAAAIGIELSTGPRGGGRSLDKIVEHVRQAEVAYLSKLGSRAPAASDERPDRPMALLHATFLEALAAVVSGKPVADPSRTRKRWPPRYAVRRAAWHVLDHAWEIEDRSGPPGHGRRGA